MAKPQKQESTMVADCCCSNKTIYFIRHAESMENLKHKSMHRVLADLKNAHVPNAQDVVHLVELLDIPAQVDTPVTPRGKRQIQDVAAQLQQTHFVRQAQIQLVVHSPLQRARETAKGLLLLSQQQQQDDDDDENSECDNSTLPPRVVQLDALRERTVDEIWIPWRKLAYTNRRHAFLVWLMEQPETVIAVVGHSEYFKSLLHLPFKFGHVDVWRAEFRPFSRKKWFGLERLYRPQLKSTATDCDESTSSSSEESSLTDA